MRVVSWSGNGFLPVLMLFIAVVFVYKKDKFLALIMSISVISGFLLKSYLQGAFQHDRPFVVGCNVLTNYANGYSFPSGHVTHYVIFFGLLLYFANRMKEHAWSYWVAGFSILNLVLIGYSRLYLGAHWFNDVAGGYLLGGLILFFSIKMHKRFTQKNES